MKRFPVQIMTHSLYEGNGEPKVSYDISLAGTTVDNVSPEDARILADMLNMLLKERKEADHE